MPEPGETIVACYVAPALPGKAHPRAVEWVSLSELQKMEAAARKAETTLAEIARRNLAETANRKWVISQNSSAHPARKNRDNKKKRRG